MLRPRCGRPRTRFPRAPGSPAAAGGAPGGSVSARVSPAKILHYLADLAASPAAGTRDGGAPAGATPETLDLTRAREPCEWLGTSVLPPGARPLADAGPPATVARYTDTVKHLVTLDALQPAEHLLRLGWVVVTGTLTTGDRPVRYCFPLLSQPVRAMPSGVRRRVTFTAAGPLELTGLVADPSDAARLEAAAEFGGGALGPAAGGDEPTMELIARLPRLRSWIGEVVAACGLPPVLGIVPPAVDPLPLRTEEGLAAVVGTILFAARDVYRPSAEAALRSWSGEEGLAGTAFARLYATQPGGHAPQDAAQEEPVCSPLRLTRTQAEAVLRCRHEPVTVISGPPGSGKSHTVAAIASDTIAQGGSVLIATRSQHAADVVASLLAREAGPDPVCFGGARADEIVAQATVAGTRERDVGAAHAALAEARDRQRLAERAVSRLLDLEQSVERAAGWDGLVGELAALAPGAFDPGSDLAALAELAEGCEPPAGAGWWRRRRAARTERRYRAALAAAPGVPLGELRTALRCATDRRAAAELMAQGGTVLGPALARLAQADEAVRRAAGRVAEVEGAREDRRRAGRAAAAQLGTALRAGRRQRVRLLRLLDGRGVVRALPLWVGTLGDVDDLLPETAALFDLVVIDEASQVDQIAAAGALLRGTRAVVVGDPHQLRHVSFVADARAARSLAAHGLERHAGRLDVRRASVLDVAAGAAPVTWLDEHFRSVPHLIEFSARRFYERRLVVATRHPGNEDADAIEVVRVPADGGRARPAELDAAMARVAQLAGEGRRDIAVVSPFREVADAAQEALLAAYELDDVERLGLRVGTVHAFQGAEADHVVLVLGLADDDGASRRRFVEDPNLFNVMVTRAKRSLAVVTSLPPRDAVASAGLIDQYLAHASRPPAPPTGGEPVTAWAAALAEALGAAGLAVRHRYPVGRWTVDMCAGDAAVAIEVAVHPDGPDAHIARHRTLGAAGWRRVDGFPTRWEDDAARAAVELAAELGHAPPRRDGALAPTDG